MRRFSCETVAITWLWFKSRYQDLYVTLSLWRLHWTAWERDGTSGGCVFGMGWEVYGPYQEACYELMFYESHSNSLIPMLLIMMCSELPALYYHLHVTLPSEWWRTDQ